MKIWLPLFVFVFIAFTYLHRSSCESSANLSEFYLPLYSPPLLSFFIHFTSEASWGYSMSAGVIQRHLSRLLQVTSSSSNREDSSNHRSISPSLDLFLYLKPSLFLCHSSLFLSIIRKLMLYNILSSPRPSPLYSLLSTHQSLSYYSILLLRSLIYILIFRSL